MKKSLLLTLGIMLSIFSFVGCSSSNKQIVVPSVIPKSVENRRTTDSTNSTNVVCNSCQASFKLSHRIQKLVNQGSAEVKCPVCHKNYLTGATVKH